jgi:hypothetical protein
MANLFNNPKVSDLILNLYEEESQTTDEKAPKRVKKGESQDRNPKETLHVSKGLLAYHSKKFEAQFLHWSDGQQRFLDIIEPSIPLFKSLIWCIYTGEVDDHVQTEDLFDLLVLADKYEVGPQIEKAISEPLVDYFHQECHLSVAVDYLEKLDRILTGASFEELREECAKILVEHYRSFDTEDIREEIAKLPFSCLVTLLSRDDVFCYCENTGTLIVQMNY